MSEKTASAQAASIDVEEVEDQARRQAFGEGGPRSAIPRDVGGGEVVLDEPGIGPLSGPEHGDALERRAGPGGVDDESGCLAHLLVGVGGGDDRDRSSSWSVCSSVVGGDGRADGVDEVTSVGVGGRVAGELRHDANVDLSAERPDEGDRTAGQLHREIQHPVPQPVGDRCSTSRVAASYRSASSYHCACERGADRSS